VFSSAIASPSPVGITVVVSDSFVVGAPFSSFCVPN
jgi:hypothetical protein